MRGVCTQAIEKKASIKSALVSAVSEARASIIHMRHWQSVNAIVSPALSWQEDT